jgi:hypothetical protein
MLIQQFINNQFQDEKFSKHNPRSGIPVVSTSCKFFLQRTSKAFETISIFGENYTNLRLFPHKILFQECQESTLKHLEFLWKLPSNSKFRVFTTEAFRSEKSTETSDNSIEVSGGINETFDSQSEYPRSFVFGKIYNFLGWNFVIFIGIFQALANEWQITTVLHFFAPISWPLGSLVSVVDFDFIL